MLGPCSQRVGGAIPPAPAQSWVLAVQPMGAEHASPTQPTMGDVGSRRWPGPGGECPDHASLLRFGRCGSRGL